MTTRNFRVKNGLSVGDIVIDSSTNKITGLSTDAPSASGDVATKGYVDGLFGAVQISGTSISSTDSSQLNLNEQVSLGGNKIVQLGTPAADTDAATKAYVDSGLSSLSSTTLTSADTNSTFVVSDTNQVATVNSAVQLTITQGLVRVHGNLTVDGTETIINTTTLSVEDNLIEVNRNVSGNAGMPSISGLKVNRGEGSSDTEQALFWAWDETFADDGSTIFGNSGGAWTAFKRADSDESNPGSSALVDIRANVIHALATSAQYADIAERFAADAPITPGAVVMLGGSEEITETAEDLSDRVFGVISTQPAYMMNNGAGNNDSHPFVAMTGRTPVRVTGEVRKGDRLVSSSIRGTARAASADEAINPFHVIGRALEDKFDDAIGLVNCVVRTNN